MFNYQPVFLCHFVLLQKLRWAHSRAGSEKPVKFAVRSLIVDPRHSLLVATSKLPPKWPREPLTGAGGGAGLWRGSDRPGTGPLFRSASGAETAHAELSSPSFLLGTHRPAVSRALPPPVLLLLRNGRGVNTRLRASCCISPDWQTRGPGQDKAHAFFSPQDVAFPSPHHGRASPSAAEPGASGRSGPFAGSRSRPTCLSLGSHSELDDDKHDTRPRPALFLDLCLLAPSLSTTRAFCFPERRPQPLDQPPHWSSFNGARDRGVPTSH